MHFKYALTAALLSSTILVGCKEQAKETKANLNQPGTFAANVETSENPLPLQEASRIADDQTVPERDRIALTQYVNPFIGTTKAQVGGVFSGNNNPGAQMPFGMVNFGPDTPGQFYGGDNPTYGWGAGGYDFFDSQINSFSLTHLNGPGCFGQWLVAIKPRINLATQAQEFALDGSQRKIESASPGFYSVKTTDGISTELSATVRTGMARFTYPAGEVPSIIIDPRKTVIDRKNMPAELADAIIDPKSMTVVSGKTSSGIFCGSDGTWRSAMYFYAEFDQKFTAQSKVNDEKAAELLFAPSDKEQTILMRVGISSVSVANAKYNLEKENNLKKENDAWDFDGIRKKAETEWNSRLNSVQLDLAKPEKLLAISAEQQGPAKEFLTQFYSGLYRSLIAPTVYSDFNGDYRSMHQKKQDDGAFPARDTEPDRQTENVKNNDGKPGEYKTHYSGFSMWDTYRSLTQFQALLYPAEVSEMMQSLIADAQQCGALPHWVNGSEDTTPMEGDHAPNVIAGAYAFGARNFDIASAAKYMWQSQTKIESSCNDQQGIGGPYADFYFKHNYIPADLETTHTISSASMTLEAVIAAESTLNFFKNTSGEISGFYDDGKKDTLVKRAGGWLDIFDDTTKELSARNKDGSFRVGGGGFQESSPKIYLWTFAHDWTRLIGKLEGSAITALDNLMSVPSSMSQGPEPTADALNGGQESPHFYIGNEPSFQAPWAYNWAGEPSRAQYIIPIIMKKTFFNAPDGLPGNDDLGSLSNWYVWASLGLFPVIPSVPGLAMSTPQVNGITIWMGNGKKLRLETTDGRNAILDGWSYIESVTLDDEKYEGSWLPLKDLKDSSVLKYKLSKTPTKWASDAKYAPPSGVDVDYTQRIAPPVSSLAVNN